MVMLTLPYSAIVPLLTIVAMLIWIGYILGISFTLRALKDASQDEMERELGSREEWI